MCYIINLLSIRFTLKHISIHIFPTINQIVNRQVLKGSVFTFNLTQLTFF